MKNLIEHLEVALLQEVVGNGQHDNQKKGNLSFAFGFVQEMGVAGVGM
jgi:hypothetical protein